jgi:biphenyl-2,3-diol 1,2-dioxygenase/3,4-dihydroxy-9,10-secoandrosta-1,3,5(10)-triene-9,17-dione 4,5-dioxygenase
MAAIRGLGYVGIEASDLPAWDFFLEQLFGVPCDRRLEDGTRVIRVDEYERRIILHPGSADDVVYIGWEAASAADVGALAQQLRAGGVVVTEADAAACTRRNVQRLIQFSDPNGLPSEIYFGLPKASEPFTSGRLAGGFVTGDGGLGHFAFVARDYRETYDFYTKLLGFRLTDHVRGPGIAGEGMCFMHANQRHHTVVFGAIENFAPMFARVPSLARKKIHHLLLEVDTPADVVRAYDRCVIDHGVPLLLKIGRHNNDSIFSFYAMTPCGFALEFGWGATLVDDATWKPSVWGFEGMWGHEMGI